MGVILSYSAEVIRDNFTVVSYSQLDCTLLRGTVYQRPNTFCSWKIYYTLKVEQENYYLNYLSNA